MDKESKDNKRDLEKTLSEIEERISKLEKENDILTLELGRSIVEKVKLVEAKDKFISMQIQQNEKYERQLEEEYPKLENHVKTLRNRLSEVERENAILLSERSEGLLKEVLRQGRKEQERTCENPSEL
ncbi:MAG: hypothetical protein K2H85_08345 [Allobaculum sp.]|nr:hypothetical protein [Allobaculum sp.]